MIPKSIIFGLLLGVCWRDTYGASYSNVYVQSGPNDPTGYATYGAPAVYTDSQFARLSGAPIGSILPIASRPNILSPCVSPCVIPSQNFAAVAQLPVTNNARVLTYRAPNLPVVVAPSKDNGYEYSYVVYDENTGDQKAQRETSDGSVVRGEYSFVEPDGYVRDVKYTADDLTGFNVVVKRILPDSFSSANKKPEVKEKSEPLPRVDVKKEALQVGPELPNNNLELNEVVVEPTTATTAAVVEDKTEAVTIPVPPSTIAIEVTQVPTEAPVPEQPQDTTTGTSDVIQAEVKEITNTQTTLLPDTNARVSYQDIIRCIQSRIQAQGLQSPSYSPLTYIILPNNGKPC